MPIKRAMIQRGATSDFGTFGRFYCGGFACYSLELPDRNNARNRSRIPAGEYLMKLVKTGRPFSGRSHSYWIHPVDDRSGILAHSGTWAGDKQRGYLTHSLGCILLGFSVGWIGGQPGLLRSRPCIWHVVDNVLEGEDTELKVI